MFVIYVCVYSADICGLRYFCVFYGLKNILLTCHEKSAVLCVFCSDFFAFLSFVCVQVILVELSSINKK